MIEFIEKLRFKTNKQVILFAFLSFLLFFRSCSVLSVGFPLNIPFIGDASLDNPFNIFIYLSGIPLFLILFWNLKEKKDNFIKRRFLVLLCFYILIALLLYLFNRLFFGVLLALVFFHVKIAVGLFCLILIIRHIEKNKQHSLLIEILFFLLA